MARFVRVVEIVDADIDELRNRSATLPRSVHAGFVPTGAGAQVTLTRSYWPVPGSRSRAVRMLQRAMHQLLRA